MKKITLAVTFVFVFCLFVGSLYSQTEQDAKDDITTVYEKIFSTGDFTDVEKYIDANIVDHTPDEGQKPGLEGLKQAFASWRKAFPDLKFKVIEIIVSGNKATVHSNITGTNTGEMMGMPPTGKKIDYNQVDIVYFNKEGKASDRWGYFEQMKMMQQLGMMK